MRIVSYNIQFGLGRDGRIDIDRVVDVVADADIIALQEVDRFWQRSGMTDQVSLLAERLAHHWWVWGPATDALAQLHPGPTGALRRQFGNMVLSRHPIMTSRNHLLPRRAFPSVLTGQRAALETVVALPSGRLIRVTSTHLDHVSSVVRVLQAEELLCIHRQGPEEGGVELGPSDHPLWQEAVQGVAPPHDHVLLGDFNMTPDSPEYAVLAGERSPWRGRLSRHDAFVDAWLLAGHAEKDGATFRHERALDAGVRIDHVLVSSGLAPLVRRAWIDGEAVASDHQPIWAELAIE